jgi:outer membrane protein OmpA-like peptidoglycan-associated protein
MKISSLLFILAAAACVAPVSSVLAQETTVMKEGQVSESALIDALAPEEPVRTRSIRVMRAGESVTPPAPPKPAKANLLITFETNSARLTEQARRSLDVLGAALASDKLGQFRFGIEGYADPRGVSANNLKLSQARAESVRDYLVANNKIDRARLEPVGKGDRNLLNSSDPSAPENRRVTIVNLSRQ